MLCMDLGIVHLPSGVVGLDIWKLLSPQLSITIFAVVFYNNQCYSRYMSLYSTCVDIDVAAKQFVSELLIHFGDEPQLSKHILQASKYCLAGIFYFYLSMEDDTPEMRESWEVITDKGLVTPEEKEMLKNYPGTTFTLLLHWSSYVVKDSIRILRAQQPPHFNAPELASMGNRMYTMIDAVAAAALRVRSIQNMPVPFSYFHLLNLLISSTVFATGIGCLILVEQEEASSYCLGFLPYMVVTFVLLALRQLSGELADPFGKDDLDFPIADFMRHIYDNVVAIETFSAKTRCPMLSMQLETGSEWTPDQVIRPCQGPSQNKALTKLKERATTRAKPDRKSQQGFRLLLEPAEVAAYGPRNWVKPEDFIGGLKLASWVERESVGAQGRGSGQDAGDTHPETVQLEPKAQMLGNAEGEKSPPKMESKEQKEPTPPAAGPSNSQDAQLSTLQRIETQMEQLVTCMSELAGNLKDIAQADPARKKEGQARTTVVKAKAKKEPVTPDVKKEEA